jgi:hypothetical protein
VAFGDKLSMTFIPMSVVGTITPFGGTSNENIEEWLVQFEWIATIHRWGQKLSNIQLSIYLSGTAKVWYKTLPVEESRDYNKLREKLVKTFQRIDIPVRRHKNWWREFRRMKKQWELMLMKR